MNRHIIQPFLMFFKRGIGKGIAGKIDEYLKTGTIKKLEEVLL